MASLEFPRQTGVIMRCAGKAGNPFQTKQGNRLSCRDQERRRCSREVVQGTSVFPSSETHISGNFWGRIKGANTVSHVKMERGTSLETLYRLRASSCDDEGARGCQCPFVLCFHPQVFLRKGVRASRSYQEQTGKSGNHHFSLALKMFCFFFFSFFF